MITPLFNGMELLIPAEPQRPAYSCGFLVDINGFICKKNDVIKL